MSRIVTYSDAIREGFEYLFSKHTEVCAIGQGLWAPWYVGNSMLDLDKLYGRERVIDSPVSEAACTGIALGAALEGLKPIVVHPRMDFLILAVDQIVTQAAKWYSMFGGQASPSLTIRAIINRGGEQGAQHSQALHSWFAHIPGLRVVMPATVEDARNLLIQSVLSPGPVLYIDDRWLYDIESELPSISTDLPSLSVERPRILRKGTDITLVGCGFSTQLCLDTVPLLSEIGVDAEVLDLRVINPLCPEKVIESVKRTGRLIVVDGGWKTCGLSAEIIATVAEAGISNLKSTPARLTIPDAPAPTSKLLENAYYPTCAQLRTRVQSMMSR